MSYSLVLRGVIMILLSLHNNFPAISICSVPVIVWCKGFLMVTRNCGNVPWVVVQVFSLVAMILGFFRR